MAQVGFGTYRVSHRSKEHKRALEKALDYGCTLIDTASHFTGGDSEKLIGEVLKTTSVKPLVITKIGETSDGGYSLSPDNIQKSLETSLKNLKLDVVDGLLLHNPETYFRSSSVSNDEFYQKIFAAFQVMQDLVKQGKIKSFGISSNTLSTPSEQKDSVSLTKLLELKRNFGFESFKLIEFPLNLLELSSLERSYEGNHLIEIAKMNGLTTLTNRPFNAMTADGLVRLATYKDFEKIEIDSESFFMEKMTPLIKVFEEKRDDEFDHFFDIPLMQQFSEIWNKQPTPDAVHQVYFQYVFPFVAQIYGRDLTATESAPFYDLYEMSVKFSRKSMHEKAIQFENKAIDMGLLYESELSLVQKTIEKYQTFGMDYILCGMRSEKYVEELKNYF